MGPTTADFPASRTLRNVNLPKARRPRRTARFAWLDILLAVVAAGGVTVSTLYEVQFKTTDYAGSDFKTLYASIWCFIHGINAYSISRLQSVFVANGVAQPPHWYGHAPVYPWTTLALGSPLTLLSMTSACWAVTVLTGSLLGIAIFALLRYAANRFDVGPVWRTIIAGLCAGTPLVAFGMDMGNVSLPASVLCFLAFVWRFSDSLRSRRGRRWVPSAALAIAFLLKPHIAIWIGLAMALLPERGGRIVAARSLGLIAGFTALVAAAMASMGMLVMQTHGYLAILAEETSAGASMSASSREVLPIVSQITSLSSVIGFWTDNSAIRIGLTCIILAGFGFLLIQQTRAVNTERGALMAAAAWSALGMMATYHRAHDAVLLLLLLVPWVVDRQRRRPFQWNAWAIAVLYAAISVSVDLSYVQHWVVDVPRYSFAAFLLLRQAGIADLLLLAAVLMALARENSAQAALPEAMTPANSISAAA